MTTTQKILLIVVFLIAACGGCVFLGYRNFQTTYTVRTARDALPTEVTFLKLPSTASKIGYWSDGLNYWAEFDITEEAFRQLFSKFKIQELLQPLEVRPKVFGDSNVFPLDAPSTPVNVSNGLRYYEHWRNGGGYEIIFDRIKSRAYYNHSRR